MWLIQCTTTMWQIQNPLRCGTIYKARYYTASLKVWYDPASLKARYDPAPLKARCCTAIPYKISKSFSQSPNTNLALFYKAQIIIWQLLSLSPNTNLALFYNGISKIPVRSGISKSPVQSGTSKSPLLHGNTLQNLKIIFTKPKY